jgi:hypothetical protein
MKVSLVFAETIEMLYDKITVKELQDSWRDPYLQWWAAGMPSFTCVNLEPWKQIRIKFNTKEDREAFASIVGCELTDKTNVIWYPEKSREKNNMNRYVED